MRLPTVKNNELVRNRKRKQINVNWMNKLICKQNSANRNNRSSLCTKTKWIVKTELARMRSWLLVSAIWFDLTLKHNIFYPSCIIYVKYLLCSLELIVSNDLIQKLKLFEVFLLNSRKRIYFNIFKAHANYKLLLWGPWHLSCYVRSILS